jgi:hypothetical protein
MKKNILIFCEGVTDQIFIADCLEILYSINIVKEIKKENKKCSIQFSNTFLFGKIIEVEGYTNIKLPINLDKFKDNTNGINLVIFDGDKPNHGKGGFENTHRSLVSLQDSVTFEFYLWPNHEMDGMIEDLLRKLIPSSKEQVMQCIENHQNCLSNLYIEGLRSANLKDMLAHYLYTNSIEKTKGRDLDYKDNTVWNLDFDKIPDLKKLKLFLDKYFLTP